MPCTDELTMKSDRGPIARLICAAAVCLSLASGASTDPTELLRRQTQELMDAFGSGGASVWERYLDPKATYTDENGTVLSKAQMVEQMKPLPRGVSGSIQVQDFHVTLHGSVAITTYVADEHEEFHGHPLHCQYRSTDTWVRSAGGWRLIASQMMALRADPPALALPERQLREYAGTYRLTPALTYEIRETDGKLQGQASGGKPESLLAEAPDVLFVPGKPRYRKIFRRDADGRITGFAERREAWDLLWQRVGPISDRPAH